ncbi:hypothetical protein KEM48_010795 [Puccinia striiformis f. sp. tritici PST-130]|nr:hypothetical protein KEM48_010795 [Puccinia striiformis f. sp. tritici PST-130]
MTVLQNRISQGDVQQKGSINSSHQAHLSPPTDYCNLTAHHHHCHQLDPIPATAHLARADQEPNQPSQAILKQLAEQLGPSNDSTLDNLHLKTSILNTGHSLTEHPHRSIYPTWFSTPLTCLLTAIGSTGAYLIARLPDQSSSSSFLALYNSSNALSTLSESKVQPTNSRLPNLARIYSLLDPPIVPMPLSTSPAEYWNSLTPVLLDSISGLITLQSTHYSNMVNHINPEINLAITPRNPTDSIQRTTTKPDPTLTTSTTTTSSSKEWISDQGGRRNTIDSVSESEDLENRLLILDHSSSYHHLHQQPHLIESSASSTDYEEYDLSSNTSNSSSTDELVIQFNPTPRSSSSSSIISKSTSPTLLSSTKLNGLKIIDHHHHLSIVQAPPPSRKLATLNPSPSLNNNNNINCSTFV